MPYKTWWACTTSNETCCATKGCLCSVVVLDGPTESTKHSSITSSAAPQHHITTTNATKLSWSPELQKEYHGLASTRLPDQDHDHLRSPQNCISRVIQPVSCWLHHYLPRLPAGRWSTSVCAGTRATPELHSHLHPTQKLIWMQHALSEAPDALTHQAGGEGASPCLDCRWTRSPKLSVYRSHSLFPTPWKWASAFRRHRFHGHRRS